MTEISFHADQTDADRLGLWAGRLGVDRSELLLTAVRKHLASLEAEAAPGAWAELLTGATESTLEDMAECCPGLECRH